MPIHVYLYIPEDECVLFLLILIKHDMQYTTSMKLVYHARILFDSAFRIVSKVMEFTTDALLVNHRNISH